MLGLYGADGLTHAGRVGTGFTQDEAKALFDGLDQIRTQTSPLNRKISPDAEKGVRWVEPHVIAEVAITDGPRTDWCGTPPFEG